MRTYYNLVVLFFCLGFIFVPPIWIAYPLYNFYCLVRDFDDELLKTRMEIFKSSCVGEDKLVATMMFGSPSFEEENIALNGWPNDVKVADLNWLYERGSCLFVVSFKNNRCISLHKYNGELSHNLHEFRMKKMLNNCIGKSTKYIEEKYGVASVYNPKNYQRTSRLYNSDEVWSYWIESDISVNLGISNDICTFGNLGHIWGVTRI